MERIFQILAVVLIGVAAFFLWQRNADGAFVSTVFGCVSFFLAIRFKVKARVEERNAEIREQKYGIDEDKNVLPENELPSEIEGIRSESDKEKLHY